jgi:predicted nucleic acid-binding protein
VTVVIDASLALGWIFERAEPREAAEADAVLASLEHRRGLVPALWHVEVLNALVVAHRRGVIAVAKALDFISSLERLPIETDVAVLPRKEHILSLAREYELSAYDSAYLDLALRADAPLATFDARLSRARDRIGLPSFS